MQSNTYKKTIFVFYLIPFNFFYVWNKFKISNKNIKEKSPVVDIELFKFNKLLNIEISHYRLKETNMHTIYLYSRYKASLLVSA